MAERAGMNSSLFGFYRARCESADTHDHHSADAETIGIDAGNLARSVDQSRTTSRLSVSRRLGAHIGVGRGDSATAKKDVRLTASALSCAARAYVPKPTRRAACQHVSRAMQAA
jgi:hypothetical protein